jgi:hypothetical protein
MKNSPIQDPTDCLFPEIATSRRDADQLKPAAKNRPRNWRARIICLAVSAFLFCFLFALLLIPVVRITPENCARIKPGMTQKQVEVILGGPPDWYDGAVGFQYVAEEPIGKGGTGLDWFASGGNIEVAFDGTGSVLKATYYPGQATGLNLESFMVERITRCTLSRWRRWWHDDIWPGRA